MNTPPKILHIFSRYQEYGGEERFYHAMTEVLKEWTQVDNFSYSSEELLKGGLKNKLLAPLKALHHEQIARLLTEKQKKEHYDLWIIHNTFPALSPIVYATAEKLQVKTLHYLHNYRFGCLNGLFLRDHQLCTLCQKGNFLPGIQHACWRKKLIPSAVAAAILWRTRSLGAHHKCHHYVAVSQRQRQLLLPAGIPAERCSVLGHFITPLEEAPPPLTQKNFLFIGRLSPEKGVQTLLKAWQKLNHPTSQLHIVGDGEERPLLEKFCQKHQLTSVHFHGFIASEKMHSLWQKTGMLLAPSLCEETFGLSVLEAWRQKRPSLVTPKGGLPELITPHENGLVSADIKEESLMNTLKEALDLPLETWQQWGENGYQKAQQDYSPKAWLQKFKGIVSDIL